MEHMLKCYYDTYKKNSNMKSENFENEINFNH